MLTLELMNFAHQALKVLYDYFSCQQQFVFALEVAKGWDNCEMAAIL